MIRGKSGVSSRRKTASGATGVRVGVRARIYGIHNGELIKRALLFAACWWLVAAAGGENRTWRFNLVARRGAARRAKENHGANPVAD